MTLQCLSCSVRTGVVGSGPYLQRPPIETTAKAFQISFPGGSLREVMALFPGAKIVAESFNTWILHSRGSIPSSRHVRLRIGLVRVVGWVLVADTEAPTARMTGRSTWQVGPHRGHIRTASSGQPRSPAVCYYGRRAGSLRVASGQEDARLAFTQQRSPSASRQEVPLGRSGVSSTSGIWRLVLSS